jgi:GT2 family glycosyltransferase
VSEVISSRDVGERGCQSAAATLVVPTRGDRAKWLAACLASIVDQGSQVRCVVVGPASDALTALCDEHGAELVVESGRGMANAVNQGLALADTPYVAWLGDDDLLSVGSLDATVGALADRPDASMAFGQCRIINGQGDRLWTIRPGRISIPIMRWNTQLVPQPGCLIRRAALDEVGLLDPDLRNPMDLDLFLRLLQWGPFSYVPRVLAAFRVHETSLTTTNPHPGAEARDVRRRYLSPRTRRASELLEPVLGTFSKAVARLQQLDPRPDRAVFID